MHRAFRSEMYLIALASLLIACPAAAPAPASTAAATAAPTAPTAPTAAPTGPSAGPAANVAATTTPVPSSDRAARVAERPARRPITAAETTALGEFLAAMQIGRTQTRAKVYPEAIAAFDRALVYQPNHPRALAERGYAKLLAKDLEGARTDLERARQRTQDPERLGPIWFNVGLVAEAAGNPEGALRAFTLSNELRPSKAAAARIAGKAVCTAEIDRAVKPGTRFASWTALYDHLRKGTDEPKLEQDREIHKALNRDPKFDAHKLWELVFYSAKEDVGANVNSTMLVGQAPDNELVLFEELNFAETSDCQSYGNLTVTPVGSLLHARYVQFEMSWERVPTDPAAKPGSCDSDSDAGCEFDCVALSGKIDDYVIDMTGKQELLRVRRTTNTITAENAKADHKDKLPTDLTLPINVTVNAENVTLKGGGCDETVPIRPPAP